MVTPDETGWRVNAVRHWLWAFTTPETTVYAICDGRGFDDAATVLGPDFAGVLVRDGWAAYRGFKHAPHQSCLNHLSRRCKQLQTDHPDSSWAGRVQAVLQDGLALRKRCNAGGITEHGLASARGRLVARLGRLIDTPPPVADAERFARHLANEFAAVFLFLCDPSIEATNWRAEQAIRPAVVTRKVCGGNRTRRGLTPSRCRPAWCAPPANATSTCPLCLPRCCAPRNLSFPTHWHCRRLPEAADHRPSPAAGSGWLSTATDRTRNRPPALPALSSRIAVSPAELAPLSTSPTRPVTDARKFQAADLPIRGILEVGIRGVGRQKEP